MEVGQVGDGVAGAEGWRSFCADGVNVMIWAVVEDVG